MQLIITGYVHLSIMWLMSAPLYHQNRSPPKSMSLRRMYNRSWFIQDQMIARYPSFLDIRTLELIPYILECNPHPFYSFRGLQNRMRIRIVYGLDLQSWAGFWKNDRATVCAVRTIQYNNLIFIIFYSSNSPSSLITESLLVTIIFIFTIVLP